MHLIHDDCNVLLFLQFLNADAVTVISMSCLETHATLIIKYFFLLEVSFFQALTQLCASLTYIPGWSKSIVFVILSCSRLFRKEIQRGKRF